MRAKEGKFFLARPEGLASVRLEEAFAAMSEGLVIHDAERRVVNANVAASRVLGLSRDQLLGRKPVDPRWRSVRSDGSDFPCREHPAMVTLLTGQASRGQVMGVHDPLRGLRWISVSADPIWGQCRHRPSAVVATYLDITERKAHEDRQAAMLDNDLLGIVKLQQSRFVWVNPGMTRIFGHTPAELLGQSTRLLHASDASYEAAGAALAQDHKPGQASRVQLEMCRKDGSLVWVDLNSVQLSGSDGITLGLFVDITPIQLELARKVEIVELQAENRQVRETSALKNALLARVSHELRTPLNAVLGFAQLLALDAVGPEMPKFHDWVGHILTSGRYLEQLINGILTYAQVESGKPEIHERPVQLGTLVEEVLLLLGADLQAKRLSVTCSIDAQLQDLVADPLRIKQVLGDLLVNAIRFTPADGHIAVRAMTVGGRALRVEVADSGIGIAEADLPRLFTTFEQLGSGLNETHGGLGLGLALSRKLIEAQGGTLGVRSQPGQGSVFHFELPCAPA